MRHTIILTCLLTLLSVVLKATPMSGIYTIGGIGANFNNLISACDSLNANGISGPVEFYVNEDQNYTAEIKLLQVQGTSSTNFIRFSGNSHELKSTTAIIISISNCNYITISGFNIISTISNATGIFITNNCNYLTISNNTIDVGITGSNTTHSGICVSTVPEVLHNIPFGNNIAKNVLIENNEINGGYQCIGLSGIWNSSKYARYDIGHIVRSNKLTNFYRYGINVAYCDSIFIQNNDISRLQRTSFNTNDMYASNFHGSRSIEFSGNNIHHSGIGNYNAYVMNYFPDDEGEIKSRFFNNNISNIETNNSISIFDITYNQVLGTDTFECYHNSIALQLPPTNTGTFIGYSAQLYESIKRIHFLKNNIFFVSGGSTANKYFIKLHPNNKIVSSNNLFYYKNTPGSSNYIGSRLLLSSNLSSWKTDAGDSTSVWGDPAFANYACGNLLPLSSVPDNAGVYTGIDFDKESATRSLITPDIGAYEFTTVTSDLALESGTIKDSRLCSDSVVITLRNVIGPTIDFATSIVLVNWEVSGPQNSSGTIVLSSDTLASGQTITIKSPGVMTTIPGSYLLKAHIYYSATNNILTNDTLCTCNVFEIAVPRLSVSPKTAFTNNPTTIGALTASSPLFPVSSGFSWLKNDTVIGTAAQVIVGPFTQPGVYQFIARLNHVCGNFYDTVTITGGPGLPVKLLDFRASRIQNDVMLTWSTASENNASHFEIYRSENGNDWSLIANVKSRRNSSITLHYEYLDMGMFSSLKNPVYYRLKSVDANAFEEWSKQVVVNPDDFFKNTVFPNPFKESVNINFNAELADICVSNVQGVELFSLKGISNHSKLDLSHLPSGIYFVSIVTKDDASVIRLLKE